MPIATRGDLNDVWKFNPSTRQWAWMGGSGTIPCTVILNVKNCTGAPGVYGTLGTIAGLNIPGGRWGATGWADTSGRQWLFGGYGIDASGQVGELNDLWEFDPSTEGWTWMGGSNKVNQPGVYGTLGIPAAGNIPGSRSGGANWTDSKGNFGLFGGNGRDAGGDDVALNDLWEFNPVTKQWAWIGGSEVINVLVGKQPAVYGTLGVPAAGNNPGSLSGAASWTDSGGNLWLLGGGTLWKYNPSTNVWAWMGGAGEPYCPYDPLIGYNVCITPPPGYGTLGLPAVGNSPGAGDAAWTDHLGNFWLFGGLGSDVTGQNGGFYLGILNSLWAFNPSTNAWAWMGGDYAASNCSFTVVVPIPFVVCDGSQGVLGSQFTPGAGNIPAARTDKNGNFWLFAGEVTNLANVPGDVNDLWEYQPSMSTFPPATAPIFSLKSGTYASGGPLIISNGMPNASIYYTTDGTIPTTASNLYSGPITLSSAKTIQAIATAPGYRSSTVSSATYNFVAAPAAPTFSLAPGTYSSVQTVTISETTPGAMIYYTTDGTTPIATSSVYSGPITVSSSETITALAVTVESGNTVWYGIALPGGGYVVSATASAAYVLNVPQAATPTYSVPSGTYTAVQTVTIRDATVGAGIYYTTDGSTPMTNSTVYKGPITVSASATIKAIAVAAGYGNSSIASAIYSINLLAPDFSVAASPASLSVTAGQSGTIAISVTPLNGFNSAVSFSCSGLPLGASCNFSPATVTPSGAAASTMLTVTTTATSAALRRNSNPLIPGSVLACALC
jgi:hypothetical protein